ncbi:methionyl-tRNA formyltransferase [Thermodesulfobacteriota bacterium]
MRIIFLGNNWVGWQVLQYLKEQKENIVGLVIHPQGKCKFRKEIIATANINSNRIIEGQNLRQPWVLDAVKALQPDMGLSILFDYILKPEFLGLFPQGVVNLHPSFLPYNLGQYPNVWSIVEGTPAGVTLHYIDKGVDTGDIIAQKQTAIEPVDTGETLYRKLEKTGVELFKKSWPLIRSGKAQRKVQDIEEGTYHATRDVDLIDAIDLDRTYTAGELINVIRARTFKPYPGAYFNHQGRKIYLRLELAYEE